MKFNTPIKLQVIMKPTDGIVPPYRRIVTEMAMNWTIKARIRLEKSTPLYPGMKLLKTRTTGSVALKTA